MNKKFTIPRDNLLISLQQIILYLLNDKFRGKAYIKELNGYIKRNQSQIGDALTKLQNQEYIEKKKEGKQTIITIANKGIEYLKNYELNVNNCISEFYEFLSAMYSNNENNYKKPEIVRPSKKSNQTRTPNFSSEKQFEKISKLFGD